MYKMKLINLIKNHFYSIKTKLKTHLFRNKINKIICKSEIKLSDKKIIFNLFNSPIITNQTPTTTFKTAARSRIVIS